MQVRLTREMILVIIGTILVCMKIIFGFMEIISRPIPATVLSTKTPEAARK